MNDLSMFTWCRVLLSCIVYAVEATQQVYKAGILHYDLSAGNIMIVQDKETKKRRGISIDWDMCPLGRSTRANPHTGRTVTWAFVSARILLSSGIVTRSLGDDIESAFWCSSRGSETSIAPSFPIPS
ncbi:hypothetical protein BYT27DRAFT_6847543 [Phlegmacium glaucopus]|nr:hypothetical protein BYT27DRAFT_6847543 [Phlegmacium glaucopus]